jgi:hypothetical protein
MFALSLEQKRHLQHKDFTFKIIILMIVIKPIVNTFYDFNILMGITLLQIFSAILFVLLLIGNLVGVKSKTNSIVFLILGLFCSLYIFNIFRTMISNFDFSTFKLLSKVSLFPLLFYYFKKHINLNIDFEIIINAFIKSTIPIIFLAIVDFLIIGNYQQNREFERFESSYGDIATVGLQLNILIIIMYYNIIKENETLFGKNRIYNLTLFFFSIFSLFKISHGSSFGVFGALSFLFIFFKLKTSIIKNLIVLSVPFIAVFIFFGSWIKKFSTVFFQREFLAILSGENILTKGYLFHGRVGRWIRHLNLFDQERDFNQFFGGIGIKYPYLMGSGPHNDYLRILFSTGYVGLMLFLILLLSLFFYSFKLKTEDKFIILCAIILIVLYSVTLTPTVYSDLCIFFISVTIINVKKNKMI